MANDPLDDMPKFTLEKDDLESFQRTRAQATNKNSKNESPVDEPASSSNSPSWFAFLFLLLIIGGVAYALLRNAASPAVQPLRKAARQITEYVRVPLVVFGHTHDEILWKLSPRDGATAWYFNTGTWIAVFTHDVLLPRDRVQYTYLEIRDHEGELRHWSPGRGATLPVVLLDAHDA